MNSARLIFAKLNLGALTTISLDRILHKGIIYIFAGPRSPRPPSSPKQKVSHYSGNTHHLSDDLLHGGGPDLRWKTTFNGRRPSIEDDLQWKTTDGGRVIMGEVSLQKSFPYSGCMCRLLRQRSDYCHRVAMSYNNIVEITL